jgi:hypothetical protein
LPERIPAQPGRTRLKGVQLAIAMGYEGPKAAIAGLDRRPAALPGPLYAQPAAHVPQKDKSMVATLVAWFSPRPTATRSVNLAEAVRLMASAVPLRRPRMGGPKTTLRLGYAFPAEH